MQQVVCNTARKKGEFVENLSWESAEKVKEKWWESRVTETWYCKRTCKSWWKIVQAHFVGFAVYTNGVVLKYCSGNGWKIVYFKEYWCCYCTGSSKQSSGRWIVIVDGVCVPALHLFSAVCANIYKSSFMSQRLGNVNSLAFTSTKVKR